MSPELHLDHLASFGIFGIFMYFRSSFALEATQLDASCRFLQIPADSCRVASPGCDDGQHLPPDLPGVKSVRFVDAGRCWYLYDEMPGTKTSYTNHSLTA